MSVRECSVRRWINKSMSSMREHIKNISMNRMMKKEI